MYRNLTLWIGVILISISILVLIGVVKTDVLLLFSISLSASLLSSADLLSEFNSKSTTLQL